MRRADLVSSLVVFIVALPLSLGIAVASGSSPAAGLLSAAIGGIVAGLLAGAPLGVTGPAAGLTALVFELVETHGMSGLAVITFLAGMIQVALGLSRSGRLFELIPKAVLEGVLSAIGAIIVLGQLHVLVGQELPNGALAAARGLPRAFASPAWGALACGAAAIAAQLAWPKRWGPAALPAVVVATAVAHFLPAPRIELEPLGPAAASGVRWFVSGEWMTRLTSFIAPAIGLAVVASAETLLTARAADVLAQLRGHIGPKADLNRELAAQGVANAVAGAVGAIPVTAVMVRTAANINAGARSRYSTVLHGAWIAAFAALAPALLERIPLAGLAAVLIVVGVKLLNVGELLKAMRHDRGDAALWAFTTAAVITTDLLKGLVAALAVHAVHRFVRNLSGKVVAPARRK